MQFLDRFNHCQIISYNEVKVLQILLHSIHPFQLPKVLQNIFTFSSTESNQLFEHQCQTTHSKSSPCQILLQAQPFDMVSHSSDILDIFFWMHTIWLMSLLKYGTRIKHMIARWRQKTMKYKVSEFQVIFGRYLVICFLLGSF